MEKGTPVALVAGVTGIIGHGISETLLKAGFRVYGAGRREKPAWLSGNLEYVQVDLLNREDVLRKLSPLKQLVTHFFWATWVPMATEEENCDVNGRMLQNVLDALLIGSDEGNKSLQHICLTTGTKHYLGPFDRFIAGAIPDTPFRENTPRLPVPNFYYVQEDIVFEAANKYNLTYSVHRPGVVFGFGPRNYMNCLAAIAVYASICKHENIPFEFTGTRYAWEQLSEASDAYLIGEQEVWAATDERGKNQTLNISNGDVFRWKNLWKVIARKMGVEAAPYGGSWLSLSEKMKGKQGVWESIVKEKKLVPTKLDEVGQFWFLDVLWKVQGPVDIVSDMNKSKELGFLGFRNTEKCAEDWIEMLKEQKIIP